MFALVESYAMTKDAKATVLRTWKERWFSFPWHPRTYTKIITVQVPREDVIIDHIHNTIYCHPEISMKIKEMLQQQVQYGNLGLY